MLSAKQWYPHSKRADFPEVHFAVTGPCVDLDKMRVPIGPGTWIVQHDDGSLAVQSPSWKPPDGIEIEVPELTPEELKALDDTIPF